MNFVDTFTKKLSLLGQGIMQVFSQMNDSKTNVKSPANSGKLRSKWRWFTDFKCQIWAEAVNMPSLLFEN